MASAGNPTPTVKIVITSPAPNPKSPPTFGHAKPISVEGKVSWDPPRVNYIRTVRLLLTRTVDGSEREISSSVATFGVGLAGQFPWSGSLTPNAESTGDSLIQAVAFDGLDTECDRDNVNIVIS